MAFKQIKRLSPFKKDLKKLLKRFRTLEDDLKIFISTQLNLFHKIKKDNDGIKQITGLEKEYPGVFKAKKFACKSLKGKGAKSGIRIISLPFNRLRRGFGSPAAGGITSCPKGANSIHNSQFTIHN